MRFIPLLLSGTTAAALSLPTHNPHRPHIPVQPLSSRSSNSTDDPTAVGPSTNTTESPTNRFILEFASGSDPSSEAASIADRTGGRVLKIFESDVFTGASLESLSQSVESLSAVEAVQSAWPARRVKLPTVIPGGSFNFSAEEQLTRRDLPVIEEPRKYSIHNMTGVAQLHQRGIYGAGVKIGVVDTGVEYTHEALGGCFGPGCKIAGGSDLVGDGNWPTDDVRQPDNDPMDQAGHGTHIAGIIAGNSSVILGVAPQSTLYSYKVFTALDGTTEDVLIDAFLTAYADNVDIITSSIGGVSGWRDGAWARVASGIVKKGVVVTISAGNDGSGGPFAASSGSSGDGVLAIASVEPETVAVSSFRTVFSKGNSTAQGGNSTEEAWVPYKALTDWYPGEKVVKDWPIVALGVTPGTGNGTLSSACDTLSDDIPSLNNTVVLVSRGGCYFAQKQSNIFTKGATHVLIANDDGSPLTNPSTTFADGVIGMITAEFSKDIVQTIKSSGSVTADFSTNPIYHIGALPNEENPGAPSSFTSIGPTNDLYLKPDVAAPGGQILSSYIGDAYTVLSGTSMACPYAAGVAALWISQHGGRSVHGDGFAAELSKRIISSGVMPAWWDGMEDPHDYNTKASAAQVGTGLLNATAILESVTTLEYAPFALNDTANFVGNHKVTITNQGTLEKTYSFSTEAFGGIYAMLTDPSQWGTPRIAWDTDVLPYPQTFAATVDLPSPVTLPAGASTEVTIEFTAPTGLNGTRLPIYSGAVYISASGVTLSIPYVGLAATMNKDIHPIISRTDGFPTLTSGRDQIPWSSKSNWTFNTDTEVNDFPQMYVRMTFTTAELRWDIFDANWTESQWAYPPMVGQNGYVGSATYWAQASGQDFFNSTSDNATDVVAFPMKEVSRDVSGYYGKWLWWFGQLADGNRIPEGSYKMRIAALVPFGDGHKTGDWDIVNTPDFEVVKA